MFLDKWLDVAGHSVRVYGSGDIDRPYMITGAPGRVDIAAEVESGVLLFLFADGFSLISSAVVKLPNDHYGALKEVEDVNGTVHRLYFDIQDAFSSPPTKAGVEDFNDAVNSVPLNSERLLDLAYDKQSNQKKRCWDSGSRSIAFVASICAIVASFNAPVPGLSTKTSFMRIYEIVDEAGRDEFLGRLVAQQMGLILGPLVLAFAVGTVTYFAKSEDKRNWSRTSCYSTIIGLFLVPLAVWGMWQN